MNTVFGKIFSEGRLDNKKRFTLLLVLIYVVSFPIVMGMTYLILKHNAINHAYRTGRLYLAAIESTRKYVGEELRPSLQRELPGRFIIEGMSRSYVAGKIAKNVTEELPDFKFKNASLNPRNPKNRADELEAGIISRFRDVKENREWKGLVTKEGNKYYVLARPGSAVLESCLQCHSRPEAAPREVVERYGPTAGFNMKAGEIVDAFFVYIPVSIPLATARQTVVYFMLIYTIFFGIVLLIINARFRWFYEKIEADKKEIEGINSEVLSLNRELEDIVAERTMSMVGLKVADRIRNPVAVIGGHCRQLLKGDVDSYYKGKLNDILSECRKMEKIVADFDVLIKSKRSQFKREDLNEIVTSTFVLMESLLREREIEHSANLHDKPLMFNANRQLIKIGLNHVLNNAIDATPPGGIIAVSTGVRGDSIFLKIADLGKGIPDDDMHKIFEPFYSTKGRSGMGLPLVRQIVGEHMGEITIDSKIGSGTTVEFIFPSRWREAGA